MYTRYTRTDRQVTTWHKDRQTGDYSNMDKVHIVIVQVQVMATHAYDCHQNVPDHSTTSGHRCKYFGLFRGLTLRLWNMKCERGQHPEFYIWLEKIPRLFRVKIVACIHTFRIVSMCTRNQLNTMHQNTWDVWPFVSCELTHLCDFEFQILAQ